MIKNRVRELREALGLSQRELGKLTGNNNITISRIENGKLKLNFATMEKFAKALKCEPWELIVSRQQIYPLNHQRIIAAYLALDDEDRRFFDKILFGEKKAQDPDHPLAPSQIPVAGAKL